MGVTRLRYEEQSHLSAEECLAAIEQRLEGGWQIAGVSGRRGRYRVIYRRTGGEGEGRDEQPWRDTNGRMR
jgi:hypothetical protein